MVNCTLLIHRYCITTIIFYDFSMFCYHTILKFISFDVLWLLRNDSACFNADRVSTQHHC